jgi:UTP:GlnB (protein PII) uridylyltransferase
MAGSKGGKPGQWSARKAQLVASEYKKAGGGYKGGEGEKQKSLKKWGKEKWMTKDEYEKGKKAKAAAKKYKEKK